MCFKKILLISNLVLSFSCIASFSCSAMMHCAGDLDKIPTKEKQNKRNNFTCDEDQTLSLYESHLGKNDDWEINNWDDVANRLNSVYHENMQIRTGRQCRERYNNYLSDKNHSSMSEDEINLLKRLVGEQGTRWEKFVTEYFPSRTVSQLKSTYASSKRNPASDLKTEDNSSCIVTVDGFSYDGFSNPSVAGHCFWNIMRRHMKNIPNADSRLQEIAQEIGATFNDYFDHFKLSSFFEKMNEKGYKVWYSLVTVDWNHLENAIDNGIFVPPELGYDVPIIRFALFGHFGYAENVDARVDGHYVEAVDSNFQLQPSEDDATLTEENGDNVKFDISDTSQYFFVPPLSCCVPNDPPRYDAASAKECNAFDTNNPLDFLWKALENVGVID